MSSRHVPALLLVCAVAASALAAAPLPIQERRLANGLKVLVLERHESPVVSCQVWYRVGSAWESPARTGLAHFLEHMMFKGTDRYKKGEIDKITQRLGGSNNASTSYDFTDYYFNFASDRWEKALEIEANRMTRCLFDPKETEAERQVVIEERLRGRDDPWDKLIEEVDAVTFMVHPYHHPVIGYVEDLRTIPRQAFVDFYGDHYRPNNATLVVVGDVDANRVFDRAAATLGRLASRAIPERARLAEPDQECERRVEFRESASVARGVVSFRAPPVSDERSVVLDVAEYLLGSGKTCRLYQRLVEAEKLCSSVSVDNESRRDHNVFQVYTELLPGKDPVRVEAIILEELARLTREPVAAPELAKAKNQLSARFVFDQETTAGLASKIGQWDIWDHHSRMNTYLDRVAAVTPGAITKEAARTFVQPNRTIGWSLEGGNSAAAAGPQANEKKRRADGEPVIRHRPGPDRAAPGVRAREGGPGSKGGSRSAAPASLDVHTFVLKNGLKVLCLPRRGLPVAAIRVRPMADSRFDPEDKAGLADFTGRMLEEGTRTRTYRQIAEAIETVGGELSCDGGGVRARVLSKDLPMALDLVADCVANSTFPADRVAIVKGQVLAQIAADEDEPAEVGAKALKELVYAGHPYHHPAYGYKATVDKLASADLQAHHGRYYAPANALLAIVGDLDPAAVRPLIEKAFGSWTAPAPVLPKLPAVVRPTKGTTRGIFMQKEQVNIYLGHVGIRRTDPDWYALTVMDHILGTSPGFADRMSRILRDEMGLCYTVYGNLAASSGLEPGLFTAYIGTSPKNREKSVQEILRLIREIREKPVGADELKDAQDYVTGSFVFRFETVSQLAGFLVESELYNLGRDYLARFPELIRKVTIADVERVARTYLDPDALSLVVVGPVDEKGNVKASSSREPSSGASPAR